MVSIAAFQAVDPGSIPGRRKTLLEIFFWFFWLFDMVRSTKNVTLKFWKMFFFGPNSEENTFLYFFPLHNH